MANQRIPYDASTQGGAKIRAAVSSLVEARKNLKELNLYLMAFDTDDTALAAATGVASGQLATLKGYVNFTQAELGDLTLGQVNSGAKTNARQLADAMG